jgi:secreted Zn-dependent insulinase-like peptidase
MENYDPALINRFLGYLSPDNVLITVIAKGLETDSTTSWFDARYRIAAVPTETVERWLGGEVDVALAIPEPNIFLPDDLTVKPVRKTAGKPALVKRDAGFAVWHQQDETYRVPRADFYFSVRSPVANDSPEHALLTELYVELINDQLTEYSDPARLAGLDYRLYKHIRGFTVRISGYDSKQGLLLSRIAETLREPVLKPDRFELFKDEIHRKLRDAVKDTPYTQALTEVRTLLVNPTWSDEQLLSALNTLEFEDLTRFVPRLLDKTQVLALSHGNVSETEALQLAKVLETSLLDTTTPTSVPHGQVIKLTENGRHVRQLDIDHGDSAIAIYFQGSDTSFADRARFGLLAQILSSPFFQDLRTEKQLGYVVHASALPLFEVPGIVFLVQSPLTNPVELEKHVERFVVGYADNIAKMPDAVFQRHKSALLTHIREREKSLSERSNRYWSELDEEHYGFDSREQLAMAVEAMSKEEFRDFYSKLFLDENQARLVVRSFGSKQKVTAAHHEHDGVDTFIQDPQTFKEGKEYFSSSVEPARSLITATRALARGERVSGDYSAQAR